MEAVGIAAHQFAATPSIKMERRIDPIQYLMKYQEAAVPGQSHAVDLAVPADGLDQAHNHASPPDYPANRVVSTTGTNQVHVSQHG